MVSGLSPLAHHTQATAVAEEAADLNSAVSVLTGQGKHILAGGNLYEGEFVEDRREVAASMCDACAGMGGPHT